MPLDIVVYRSDKPWSTPKENAFLAGLRKHGLNPEERSPASIRVSDLAVIWAHRHTEMFASQREAGNHYLVMERGYLGDIGMRRAWTSLGFDGLNGRARFPKAPDGERWERHFGRMMQPWKDSGDVAVVMGQVKGDASLRGFDIHDWYEVAACNLAAEWKIPVVFRPHPNDQTAKTPTGAQRHGGAIAELLGRARVVATFNSTSGVESVLAGVPTISCDKGSMAWDVTAHDWDHCCKPDRTKWAQDLAWTQWSDAEMSSGQAWEHLRDLI